MSYGEVVERKDPLKFVARNLGDPLALEHWLSLGNQLTDRGRVIVGYGVDSVTPHEEPPSAVVWLRELKEGTDPRDRHYSGQSKIVTIEDYASRFDVKA